MKELKIGIVGMGYWGPKLVPIFKSIPGVIVTQLCDLHQEKLERITKETTVEYPGTPDFEKLLRNIDAVCIVTPPATHFELALKALLAGKHIFVEKPLAVKRQEVEELTRLGKEKKCILFVDHTFCYDEAFWKIQKIVQGGQLGNITNASFDWLGARQKEQGPDILWDSGPHAVAALVFLLGKKPKSISISTLQRLPNGIPSAMKGTVSFEDRASARIVIAWKDQTIEGKAVGKSALVTVVGAKGAIVYEGSFGTRKALLYDNNVTLSKSSHPLEPMIPLNDGKLAKPLDDLTYKDEPLKTACHAFIKAIREEQPPITDGNFGAKVVEILEAAETSAKENGREILLRTK